MPVTTSVTVDGMQRAQSDFENALNQMNSTYSDMEEQRSTLAANWTGESSSVFGNALATWLDDLNAVRNQLNGLLSRMGTNTNVYSRTNENSTQLATSFSSGLPGLSS